MRMDGLPYPALALIDTAGFNGIRRWLGARQDVGSRGLLSPDVIGVAFYWVLVIGIDLLNDWFISGIADGFRPFREVASSVALWWSTWIVMTPLVVAVARANVRSDRGPWQAGAGLLGLGFILALAHLAITIGLFVLSTHAPIQRLATNFAASFTLAEALTYAGLVGACLVPDLWLRRRSAGIERRSLEIRASHADRLEADATLATLRRELDAHLLINALTGASGAIREARPDHAVATLARIGDMVRASMDAAGYREITVEREIQLLERYLDIERSRRERPLRFEIDVSPDARSAMVPPFVLQPLVENAIHHGTNDPPAVTVRVQRKTEGVELIVRNGAKAPVRREGTGLANTRKRLAHLYGAAASLTLERRHGEMVATVRIPASRVRTR